MTDQEMLFLLGSSNRFNKARKIFNETSGRIEQLAAQGISPVRIRKLEFEAVQRILAIFGLNEDGDHL